MSKIEVNEIDNLSGSSTLTLGKDNTTTLDLGSNITSGTMINRPAFKVTLSSNQTLSDDTLTRVAWDTEEYDTDSAFDTSTNLFTCPTGKPGKYVFEFHVFGDDIDDGDIWSTYLELNGVAVVGSFEAHRASGNTQNCEVSGNVTVTLVAGDTIEVVAKHTGTSASQEIRSNASFFSGYRLIGV